jgi:hypothetical protein
MRKEGREGIMYVRGLRRSFALCASLLLAACASMEHQVAQQPAGYWSQVEDFGTNPPPEGYDTGSDATFYPYVQQPRGFDVYSGYGGYGYYGGVTGFEELYGPYGIAPPGFGSFYYGNSFYGTNPYLYGGPVFVPTPGVTPMPRPRPGPPPPANRPPPHPVTPKPSRPPIASPPPAPRHAPMPRANPDRGAQPVRN